MKYYSEKPGDLFMKNIESLIVALLFLTNISGYSQINSTDREFRGAWVATVVNLDWPSSPALPVEKQKEELINLFDALAFLNFNAVFFQVRPECDALYNSNIEPWSFWLTGKQGKAPEPFYDPLEFAIEEAHKRGLELHAWINPYRAVRKTGTYPLASNHVSRLHPEWIITSGKLKYLNPGLPQVRRYVVNIVKEIVGNYNVDGIHFDDYFYPYPPNEIKSEDFKTFQHYSRGINDISEWRRDNVNLLMKEVNGAIKRIKPFVKFGVSPFGIWKNNVPRGITGFDAYGRIYADAVQWIKDGSIDYLVPQLYWPFDGGQDFAKLSDWWSLQKYESHFYAGLGFYRAEIWNASEIPNQIRYLRENPFADGFVIFRAANVFDNVKNVTDSLGRNLLRYKTIAPVLNRMNFLPPTSPQNFRLSEINDTEGVFSWSKSDSYAPQNVRYVISVVPDRKNHLTNCINSPNIVYLTYNNYFKVKFIKTGIRLNYFVRAVSPAGIESGYVNFITAPPIIISGTYKDIEKMSVRKLEKTKADFCDFEITIPEKQYVKISLYNSFNNPVAVFTDSIVEKGIYKTSLPAKILKRGVYWMQVSAGNKFFVKKIIL